MDNQQQIPQYQPQPQQPQQIPQPQLQQQQILSTPQQEQQTANVPLPSTNSSVPPITDVTELWRLCQQLRARNLELECEVIQLRAELAAEKKRTELALKRVGWNTVNLNGETQKEPALEPSNVFAPSQAIVPPEQSIFIQSGTASPSPPVDYALSPPVSIAGPAPESTPPATGTVKEVANVNTTPVEASIAIAVESSTQSTSAQDASTLTKNPESQKPDVLPTSSPLEASRTQLEPQQEAFGSKIAESEPDNLNTSEYEEEKRKTVFIDVDGLSSDLSYLNF